MTSHPDFAPVKRALISVSDKTGIVDFAKQLTALGVEILSTGGTYKLLKDNAVAVTEVSEYTQFPEMMDGRVKTLHPKIHGGILGRRGTDDAVMTQHGIKPIDMVVVNLYPFEQTVAKENCLLEDAIENIDDILEWSGKMGKRGHAAQIFAVCFRAIKAQQTALVEKQQG